MQDEVPQDSNDQGLTSVYADVITGDMWEELLTTQATIIDPLPKHLQKAYAEAKCEVMQQILTIPPDPTNEHDATQAWMCLLLFDKLVAHAKTDPSISLNATMRQRLRQAMDGEWMYLATDFIDKWTKGSSPRTHPKKTPSPQQPNGYRP